MGKAKKSVDVTRIGEMLKELRQELEVKTEKLRGQELAFKLFRVLCKVDQAERLFIELKMEEPPPGSDEEG